MSHEQAAIEPLAIECCWLREAVTTLDGALTLSSGTDAFDVADASGIAVGDTLSIDDELMDVEIVSGTTLTVDRATDDTEPAAHDDGAEVGVFKRRRFKLMQELRQQAVDRFAGKVTIGDYSKDSNDTLSAWVISDLTGGHGIADHQEGVTDNRYRFGTLYTRYPGQWSKPFEITKTTLGTGAVFPLGDLFYGTTFYRMVASGTTLFQDTTSRGVMSGDPASRGVAFRGIASQHLFYIPLGFSGYATFDPSSNTLTSNNTAADPDAQAFLLWNDLLLVLDNDGTLSYATAAAATTTFTPYTLGGNPVRVESNFDLKKLHVFYDRQGNAVPHVVSAGDVWVFDPDTPRLTPIPDFGGVHPHFGVASEVWRGELYVGSGLDVMAYNGEVLRFTTSLSRDDGLPYPYQGGGYIRDLVAGQNALVALVRGQTTGGVTYHSVHEWSGFGWHCVYATSDAQVPVRALVSRAGNAYRLHWGLSNNGEIYTQELPVGFTNPREAIAASGDIIMGDFTVTTGSDYTQTYYLESGRFDANMKGYRKIAHGIELDVRSLAEGYETVRMWYRIDGETDWTQLGDDITARGHHLHQFGPVDPNGFHVGLDFELIEFRFEVIDQIPNPYIQSTSAVIESAVFSFHKRMHPALAWTADIDASGEYHDASAEQQVADLTELRTLGRFFSARHGTRQARAVITGQSGNVSGGWDPGGRFQISMLEIADQLGV